MKRLLAFLFRHKKAIAISFGLLIVGAFFRWEVREVDDAQTDASITRYSGPVFPWQPCGVSSGGSRPVNYYVKHWCVYGLVRLEASGQEY